MKEKYIKWYSMNVLQWWKWNEEKKYMKWKKWRRPRNILIWYEEGREINIWSKYNGNDVMKIDIWYTMKAMKRKPANIWKWNINDVIIDIQYTMWREWPLMWRENNVEMKIWRAIILMKTPYLIICIRLATWHRQHCADVSVSL